MHKIKKESQVLEGTPIYVAEEIVNIIKIMINSMNPESRGKAFVNLKEKISDFNPMEIANKKAPGGAAIGVSLSLIKNILNGKDPYFVNTVLNEVLLRL
jgi:hypothetical protein